MNAERLLKLAGHLLSVRPDRFDMSTWCKRKETARCGFAGCAAGHAAHSKLFPGLQLLAEKKRDPAGQLKLLYVHEGHVLHAYEGLAVLFDVATDEAEYFFDPMEYSGLNIPPKRVANRIERFVETGERDYDT